MILADWQIKSRFKHLIHGVLDWDAQIQPASLDLRLHPELAVYDDEGEPIDPMNPPDVTKFEMDPTGFCLGPGEFVLGSTIELLNLPNDVTAVVEGKSTLGRLGLTAHVTAGFIDPGFRGQITLEIKNLQPRRSIILTPGMPICQLVFHRHEPAAKPYAGKYLQQTGPTGARKS